MNDITFRVSPTISGWSVGCDLLEPTYYRSGARAEAAARSLAIRLTDTGCNTRIVIRDLTHQVVATHRYFGA